jgi:hypothetical protein
MSVTTSSNAEELLTSYVIEVHALRWESVLAILARVVFE